MAPRELLGVTDSGTAIGDEDSCPPQTVGPEGLPRGAAAAGGSRVSLSLPQGSRARERPLTPGQPSPEGPPPQGGLGLCQASAGPRL